MLGQRGHLNNFMTLHRKNISKSKKIHLCTFTLLAIKYQEQRILNARKTSDVTEKHERSRWRTLVRFDFQDIGENSLTALLRIQAIEISAQDIKFLISFKKYFTKQIWRKIFLHDITCLARFVD